MLKDNRLAKLELDWMEQPTIGWINYTQDVARPERIAWNKTAHDRAIEDASVNQTSRIAV
jgi:hypothetical protein